MFRVDGRTDMTKLIVAFRDFANAPKKKVLPYTRIRVPDRLACNPSSMPNALLALASMWLMFLAPLVSQQVFYIFFPQPSTVSLFVGRCPTVCTSRMRGS